ncbi:F-box only protein 24 isoform X2 [Pseudophryne corroboree]|uniref:F-box only protein 24 isoform X2 n=1 Tax=Pseudophryne corroboree TaxID=495146 RepID=UPI0030818A4A
METVNKAGGQSESRLVKRRYVQPRTPSQKTSCATLQDLPAELIEKIISHLSVRDVVRLGETCRYLHQMCNGTRIWRALCEKTFPCVTEDTNWRKSTILNYTKGVYFHPFLRRQRLQSSNAVAPANSHGFRRFLITKDSVFVLDYAGTLFFICRPSPACNRSHASAQCKSSYIRLCERVKDFSSDPRNDVVYRKYIYVLVSQELERLPGTAQGSGECDCVEVYRQNTGQRVFRMTFHPTMRLQQLALLGPETDRLLLLLSGDGKVYSLEINETQLDLPRSYTIQLSIRRVSWSLSDVTVAQMCSNQSSVIYITDLGAVYLEVYSPAVYRDLFGTLQGFDVRDQQMPLTIPLPSKVVQCSLGYSHLALVDEFGRIFMQGNNRFGQLGTWDKIDRAEPSQVHYLNNPVDIFCGLNHTLVLVSREDFIKEIYGCGCGAGGRLPGWPKGSPSFVKLLMKVPVCARGICPTRDQLYILSCYDTEDDIEHRYRRCKSSDAEMKEEDAQACEDGLNQLRRCASVPERVTRTRDLVAQMPLLRFQKECLWEALGLIERAAEGRERAPAGPGTLHRL